MKSELKEKAITTVVVTGEIVVSLVVGGALDTYGKDNTLAGVVLFLGLEAMRYWRKYAGGKKQ